MHLQGKPNQAASDPISGFIPVELDVGHTHTPVVFERHSNRGQKNHFFRLQGGFTLVELLMVGAILSLMLGMLFPVLSKARCKARTAVCVQNLRHLQTGWLIYAEDHQGWMPLNTARLKHGLWESSSGSWIGASHAKRDTMAGVIEKGALLAGGYITSVEVLRCPSDDSLTLDATHDRLRSYALNGNLAGRKDEVQQTAWNINQMVHPSGTFGFIDENEDSIDDGHFLVWPAPDHRWVNMPADRHAQGGILSFLDGRVERWPWKWEKVFSNKTSYWKPAANKKDLEDLRRLQEATLPIKKFKLQDYEN